MAIDENTLTDGLRISNEFAEAVVTRVSHGNGTRLRITAPRAGRESVIDAIVLEALAAISPEDLTAILVSTVPGNDRPQLLERLRSVNGH